jgi:predicted MFS family arabinose efflux permease
LLNAALNQRWILFIIVLSQFACTSLWFAGNAVMADILGKLGLASHSLGHLVSAVQLGFITGTFTFAIFNVSDRLSPSLVFFISAIAGAAANLGIFLANSFTAVLLFRFITGFFLAGIYPVGMKIAADYHRQGLGKALGYLVGALVIGTALPHLLKGLTTNLSWHVVIFITSGLAVTGGALIYLLVPDGPFRNPSSRLEFQAFLKIFRNETFRRAAFGYFGHMWELYTLWAFLPVILATYSKNHPESVFNISYLTFGIIGIGSVACVAGGYISRYAGSNKTAFFSLLLSCLCCLLSPVLFKAPVFIFLGFLFSWGMVVVSDSPQFSTLVAQSAPAAFKGTALTIVNCAGFLITIISIQTISYLSQLLPLQYIFVFLAIGPLLGLLNMAKFRASKST